jgi:hypothetical protein
MKHHAEQIVYNSKGAPFFDVATYVVTTLGLAWLCRQLGILADGRVESFDV